MKIVYLLTEISCMFEIYIKNTAVFRTSFYRLKRPNRFYTNTSRYELKGVFSVKRLAVLRPVLLAFKH